MSTPFKMKEKSNPIPNKGERWVDYTNRMGRGGAPVTPKEKKSNMYWDGNKWVKKG